MIRGWLGVAIQDVDQELADAMTVCRQRLAFYYPMSRPGTPAANEPASRVAMSCSKSTARSSTPVVSSANVIAASGSKRRVHLDLIRDGKAVSSDVELGEMPEADATASSGPNSAQGSALDGIVLENINPQNRRAFEIDDALKQGVVITRLDPQSNAAHAGLGRARGRRAFGVNRVRIDSPQRFQELYSKSKSRVLLLVNRHGSTSYVVVKG